MTHSSDRAIAIVGVGAMLPDAPNAPAFWDNIINKRYCIRETPPERWSIADYYDPDPTAPDKTYSKIGGWVRGFQFDWKKYRVPPKVAAAMDESQQWAVTISDEALTDYGFPNRPLDTDRTGVILGTAMGGELHYITQNRVVFPEFAHALEAVPEFAGLPAPVRESIVAQWHARMNDRLPPITEDTMPGELANIVAGRVANVLNLRGANFITDAACASSFAAINAAFEMLTEHQVDAVVAGGVDRNMGTASFVKFCKIGALSATGSRPFGDGADGFVMGEGAASFLLKRLSDAERDGDKIYAVIRGVGASSDGKGKGITAPNPVGQVLAAHAGVGKCRHRSGHCDAGGSSRHQHQGRRRRRGGKPHEGLWRRSPPQRGLGLGEGQHRPPQGRRRRGRPAQGDDGPPPQGAAAHAQLGPAEPQYRFRQLAFLSGPRAARRGKPPRTPHAGPASAPTASAAPTSTWCWKNMCRAC